MGRRLPIGYVDYTRAQECSESECQVRRRPRKGGFAPFWDIAKRHSEPDEPPKENFTYQHLIGSYHRWFRHRSDDLKNQLIAHNGSLQNIDLPKDLKELYKTVWEIKQKRVIEMAAERGAYIDQSQSLNIHMTDCTMQKLSSMHFYGWKLGLKTGQYYLRTKAAVEAIKFTVDQESLKKKQEDMVKEQEAKSKYECVGCGS